MSVKLTEKEITALAKKIADKKNDDLKKQKAALAQRKIPEAKKIKAQLDLLPETVLEFLYSRRYNRQIITVKDIANRIIDFEPEDFEPIKAEKFESDIVLAAHDAKDMASLCKKFGI